MGSPYGADIISVISPPIGPQGELVPLPGLPPGGIPPYLKPIPVNTRDIQLEFAKYLKANNKKVMRWLYSTWTAESNAIKYQEIRNAMKTGELSVQTLDAISKEWAKFINDKLAPQWRKAWDKGGKVLTGPGFFGGANVVELGVTEYSKLWIESRGGELAVNMNADQMKALRNILRHFIVDEPMGPQALAIELRSTIGLTYEETKNYIAARAKWFNMGKTAKEIEHLSGNYYGYLHRRRAQRIAITELSYAYNFGQFDAVQQAQAQGLFKGGVIIKRWDASFEASCRFCSGLHGEIIGMEDTFPGATKRIPNTYCPPAHPNCMCVVFYEFYEYGAAMPI